MGQQLRIRVLPKQMEILRARERELVYSGAYGAGKTAAACIFALSRAMQHPRAHVLLFRKVLADLRSTVLMMLERGSGKIPPLLQPGTFSHNKATRIISLSNGGTIEYNGLDNQTGARVVGRNATHAVIDQAEELSIDDFVAINTRIRADLEGVTRQILLVCNPGPPSHWMAKRYGLAKSVPECKETFRVVRTSSADNRHLPPDQIAFLNSLTGVTYRRYVLGEWCGSEGAIYENFLRERHVKRVHPSRFHELYVGVDDGTNNPFVGILVGRDSDGRLHVMRSTRGRGLVEDEKVTAIRSLGTHEAVVIDPAAAAVKTALRRRGFTVHDGENDVLAGIHVVRSLLGPGADGEPMLTFDPGCEDVIEEMESYEWDEDKEKPVKVNDHAPDALRYVAMHLRPAPDALIGESEVAHSTSVAEDNDPEERGLFVADDIEIVKGRPAKFSKQTGEGPAWRVWETKPLATYAIGVCTPAAEGRGEACIKAINCRTRTTAAELVGCLHPEDVARQVACLRMWLVGSREVMCPVVVMADGTGVEVIRHMRKVEMPGLWTDSAGDPGWSYTVEAQSTLFSRLRAALRDKAYTELSLPTLGELRRYVVVGAGQVMPWHAKVSGLHPSLVSDRVKATMLAWQGALTVPRDDVRLNPPPANSIAGRNPEWFEDEDE